MLTLRVPLKFQSTPSLFQSTPSLFRSHSCLDCNTGPLHVTIRNNQVVKVRIGFRNRTESIWSLNSIGSFDGLCNG